MTLIRTLSPILISVLITCSGFAQNFPPHDPNDPSHGYDYECCALNDCAPMSSDEFMLDDGHIVIVATGERFPLDTLRPSKDGQWHRCIYLNSGKTRTTFAAPSTCIYAPQAF